MFTAITELNSIINNREYKVAAYIRLSREDDNDGESESITNQKNFLSNWATENNYAIADYYIDDGYTGTNFNRPSFQKLIRDIENGIINMVVTKDLSRLGRDYIGIGEYIEKYFPINHVRYIAVNDGIDTFNDASGNEMAPFKAVFNDMYAKDISKKVRTALRTKQKMGLWVGGCPPMGYMVDSNNKNHLIPDPEEDYIIKYIFKLALSGCNVNDIKYKLIEEKIPTRAMLKGSVNNRISAKDSKNGIWNIKTINTILKNRLYTGDMVQNRRKKINYKIKKIIKLPEEEWIIVPNTHEALVSKSDFEKVQKILVHNVVKSNKQNHYLLDNLLYCYECKHKIGICNPRKSDGRVYVVCNYYRQNSKLHLCTSHGFNYEYLEKAVLNTIKNVAIEKLNKKELLSKTGNIVFENPKDKLKKEIQMLKIQITNETNNLDKVYLDNLSGKIGNDMYNRVFQKISEKIKELKYDLNNKEIQLSNVNEKNNTDIDKMKLLEEFINMKEPTRDIILSLIDKIEVHKDKQLDIYFSFKELNNF
ncbi:MAG: recombinase family protein [Bacilli bacterium]